MIHFSEDYFKTETRDGFTIDELMKRAWAAQLEVLNAVITICDKYQLTYYAYFGTLLGAVRHGGYIPWDDDLDIAMKKEDYIKFLQVARAELPKEYCILNVYTETEYTDAFTRITSGKAIELSESKMAKLHECPFAVGLDIFPLYYVPRNEGDAQVQKTILRTIGDVTALVESKVKDKALIAKSLMELEKTTGYQFTTDRPIPNHLRILYDQMCRLFDEEESDVLTVFPLYMQKGYRVEKELLAECIQLPFESLSLTVPKGYDKILTKSYRDYMVPRQVQAAHDYPFYKGQLEVLGRHIEKLDCEWKERQLKLSNDSAELVRDKKMGLQLPKEWMEKIYSEAAGGKRRKIVLYHTSADALMCHGPHVVNKLRSVLEQFRKNPDVLLWWFPCVLDNPELPYIKRMAPELVRDYSQIVEEFQNENWGICDTSGDMHRAVAMADAYYGDVSGLLQLFRKTRKAVMLQDYELGD